MWVLQSHWGFINLNSHHMQAAQRHTAQGVCRGGCFNFMVSPDTQWVLDQPGLEWGLSPKQRKQISTRNNTIFFPKSLNRVTRPSLPSYEFTLNLSNEDRGVGENVQMNCKYRTIFLCSVTSKKNMELQNTIHLLLKFHFLFLISAIV